MTKSLHLFWLNKKTEGGGEAFLSNQKAYKEGSQCIFLKKIIFLNLFLILHTSPYVILMEANRSEAGSTYIPTYRHLETIF